VDRKYITQTKFDALEILTGEISKMISSLITYQGKSDFRGQKFKAGEK